MSLALLLPAEEFKNSRSQEANEWCDVELGARLLVLS
jgi:hypothetical protein